MNADSRAEARQWLVKFSGGECPQQDRDAFRRWLEASGDNQRAFDELQQLWGELDEVGSEMLAAHGDIPRRTGRPVWSVAASAVITALFAALLWQWLVQSPDMAAPSVSSYSTQTAELREIILVDGSEVMLGARSRLEVEFSNDYRRLTLVKGEAWFKVVSDSGRPFVVQAGSGSATAIGTAFSVHRGHDTVTVTVEEGIVAVSGDRTVGGSPSQLSASQQIAYNSNGHLSEIAAVAPEYLGSWRQGQRVFHNTPLQELVTDLNRYSAKPVIIADPALRQVAVSGVFSQFADTAAVLRTIEQSMLARVEESQGSIVLLQP